MEIAEEKKALRREMRRRLAVLARRRDGDEGTETDVAEAFPPSAIRPRLEAEVRGAKSLMIYLNTPTEFPTIPLLWSLFLNGPQPRNLVVPWCRGKDIELFFLLSPDFCFPTASKKTGDAEIAFRRALERQGENFGEKLGRGTFGILEPRPEWRDRPECRFDPARLDAVLLPGLAFDRFGGRLGRGGGFYDRFLPKLRPDCRLIGLAFDAQWVERVPTESHDRPMDVVLTPGGPLTL